MKWNDRFDDAPIEDNLFNSPLVDVKLEPKTLEQYGCQHYNFNTNLKCLPMAYSDNGSESLPDADLLDIKLEDLCSSYYAANGGSEHEPFTFVEPRPCNDDPGYDTCTTFSSTESGEADQDWIDSPSSVESFLSSCSSGMINAYLEPQTLQPEPTFKPPTTVPVTAQQPLIAQQPVIAQQPCDTIQQAAITPINQQQILAQAMNELFPLCEQNTELNQSPHNPPTHNPGTTTLPAVPSKYFRSISSPSKSSGRSAQRRRQPRNQKRNQINNNITSQNATASTTNTRLASLPQLLHYCI